MTPVFLDSVGLLAVWNRSDQWHADATRAYTALSDRRVLVTTTTFVLAECGNAVARLPAREAVQDFRTRLEARRLLVWPDASDWLMAWEEYRTSPTRASIVDCLSFAVMRRLGIQEVFSNDRHFAAMGFRLLF